MLIGLALVRSPGKLILLVQKDRKEHFSSVFAPRCVLCRVDGFLDCPIPCPAGGHVSYSALADDPATFRHWRERGLFYNSRLGSRGSALGRLHELRSLSR